MRRWLGLVVLLAALVCPREASAYGVLAHQAIIDAVWDSSIAPLLRSRYRLTPTQLREAKAFAYGGAIIQDSGYYPFSSRTFGNLTHYVRSGDFVAALLREASTADEFAFALGALAHYLADNDGHPVAVNRAVPLMFPKMGEKYGPDVTYAEDATSHLRTEFSLDVVQVARGAYAPQAYHDFVGFEVSRPVLERAFLRTYGLKLDDVFGDYDLAIGTFRWAVSQMVPALTKDAWKSKHEEIEKRFPDATMQRYVFVMTRRDYEQEWGTKYRKPNPFVRLLGWMARVLPKIGPLKPIAFKPPTPEAERLFLRSFNETVTQYRSLLAEAGRGAVKLTNRNFDTGRPIRAGDYRLVDEAYAQWLMTAAKQHFDGLPAAARANILTFYSDLDAPIDTKRHRGDWRKVLAALAMLRASSATPPKMH